MLPAPESADHDHKLAKNCVPEPIFESLTDQKRLACYRNNTKPAPRGVGAHPATSWARKNTGPRRSAPFRLKPTRQNKRKCKHQLRRLKLKPSVGLFRGKRDDGVIRVAAFHFQELREHVFSAQNPNEHLLLAFQFRQLAAFLVVQV